MTKQKMIPCRVCGKLFKPCGYCQSHSDIFRWRNFACSRECAGKYINDTIAYRELQHKNNVSEVSPNQKRIIPKKTCIKRLIENPLKLQIFLIMSRKNLQKTNQVKKPNKDIVYCDYK